MALLAAAVAALAALVLIDLVLSAAIIRRLRGTEERIDELTAPPVSGLMVGENMPEFVTPDGGLTRADLAGEQALIAFFATGCRHCPGQARQLADRAPRLAGAGIRVLSVVTVAPGDVDELTATLHEAGRVVTETGSATMMGAFHEQATPSFLLFGVAGHLLARGHDLDALLDSPDGVLESR
jgi:AhpC/TSA family